MNQDTRFFCQCGRLLMAPPSATMVDCPTCRTKNTVPGQHSVSSSGASTAVLAPGAGARIGHFILEQSIGQGGMGSVYRAVDQQTGRRVAVKLLHSYLQARPDFVTRFQREARAASSLHHDNIVQVLDFGIEDSVPFLAMELLEGADLMALARRQAVTEHQALQWMLQAAAGLEAAAGRGITHRDIKPTNLVVTGERLKIADFGLAKASDSDSHLTVTGEVLGTPNYMSPEQGRGAAVDLRSDLYSLGATFYHLLAGKPVFEAETPVAVIMKHLHEEPVPLRTHAPHLSKGLEKIIHGLLQKNPAHRYQSYSSLIRDLKAVARGRDPERGAAPPSRKVQDGGKTYILPAEDRTELLLKPAGFLRRTLAMTMDLILIEVLAYLVHLVESGFQGTYVLYDEVSWAAGTQGSMMLAVILVIATLAYFGASDAAGGKSFGKTRLRLRVCRLDGSDLGGLRGLLHTLIALPGMLLFAPTLNWAVIKLLQRAGVSLNHQDQPRLWAFGAAYLASLWVLGRLAGGGRPLHDVIAGARVYRAHAREEVHRLVRTSRAPSPRMAAALSLFPGVGLMYAGRVGLGLLFLVLIPMAWTTADDSPGWPLGLWAASAFLAYASAQRKTRAARLAGRDPALGPEVIRRQES